jgi:hypothetical protein
MDLQTERNIETLMRLAGNKSFTQTHEMTFYIGPTQFTLDVLPERLVLSAVSDIRSAAILPRILQQCCPQNTYGVVQRVFIIKNQLYVNCELPSDEDAYFWWQIVNWQKKLLTNYAGRK